MAGNFHCILNFQFFNKIIRIKSHYTVIKLILSNNLGNKYIKMHFESFDKKQLINQLYNIIDIHYYVAS